MRIGLITDLAIGLDRSGAQVSADPEAFLTDLSIGAPPDLLPEDLCEQTANSLRGKWEKDNEGRAWDRAIEDGSSDVLLFAVAEYHARPDLAKRVLDKKLKDAGEAPADGPYR